MKDVVLGEGLIALADLDAARLVESSPVETLPPSNLLSVESPTMPTFGIAAQDVEDEMGSYSHTGTDACSNGR